MPAIKNYTAQVQPASTGFQRASPENFGASIGAGLEGIGRGVEKLNQNMEESESMKALVGSSQIRAKYMQLLDDAQTSGADTAPLKAKMADELAAVGENFSTLKGQQVLAHDSARTGMMFDEQANRIAVVRASEQAQLQGKQFADSETANLMRSPSYLPFATQNAEAFTNTLSNIPPEKRALMKQQLEELFNTTAVNASARIDPQGTIDKLKAGEWTLSGPQRQEGIHTAESRIRELRADDANQRAIRNDQQRQANEDAAQGIVTKMIAGKLGKGEINDTADLTFETKENLIHFEHFLANEKDVKTHPSQMADFFLAVNAPEGDSRKIYNSDSVFRAVERGDLNAKTEAPLVMSWIAGQKDADGRAFTTRLAARMQVIKSALTASPEYSAQPELSGAIQMEFINRAEAKASELRRKGDKGEDPTTILDPNSKNFMFGPGSLAAVARDVKAQGRAQLITKTTGPDDPAYKDLQPGMQYYDANGVLSVKSRPPKGAETPQTKATLLDIQKGYIERVSNRGPEVRINAPLRSSARRLQGKTFQSEADALTALQGLQERAP
jgi:hypothetical protein